MRIGILTLALHANYGGILQAYALQTVLERLGHEVAVFNVPPRYIKPSFFTITKRMIKRFFGKNEVVFSEVKNFREAPIINKEIYRFRKQYVHEKTVNNLTEINKEDFDCIVVGSDQVWRPKYFKEQWLTGVEDSFLAFTSNWSICRIAYAASLGVDKWEQTLAETEKSRKAIAAFNAVSVREESGIGLLKSNLLKESVKVLDPTMLLTKADYTKLIESSQVRNPHGKLLIYILNKSDEKSSFIQKISEEKKLNPFSINNALTNPNNKPEERIMPSIEEWLNGFCQAEFVITDSFHACVFSIIFNKPFIAIGNVERGLSRFQSLLSDFGLEKNLLTDINNYDSTHDYSFDSNVSKILESKRQLSFEFLKNNIK